MPALTLTQLFTNNAVTLLAAPIGITDTSLRVMTGYGALFPQPVGDGSDYFLVTLENQTASAQEIVQVTARAGDVFTIVRAQEGTAVHAWGASSGNDTLVDHRVTADTMRRAMQLPETSSPSSDVDLHGFTTLAPISVGAGLTLPLNTVTYSQFQRGFKYFITIVGGPADLSCTFEVLVNVSGKLTTNSETVTRNRSSRVGHNFTGSVNTTLNLVTKELDLTWSNGETYPVEILCARIQCLP